MDLRHDRFSRGASLYLVGDPFQKPNAAGTTGAGANGQGMLRWNWPAMRDPYDADYAKKPATAISLCHNNDVICDFGTYGQAEHENYYKDGRGEERAGQGAWQHRPRGGARGAQPDAHA